MPDINITGGLADLVDAVKETNKSLQQLNNTIFEIYTGKTNAIYPVLGNNPADFGTREPSLVPFQERIKKTTEVLSGILVGIYDENEIKTKLENLDINDLESIEENLEKINENTSFLKTYIRRTSNFGVKGEHTSINPFFEIEIAIKALVLSFIRNDLSNEVKLAEMKKEKYPENITKGSLAGVGEAYNKITKTFVDDINGHDPEPP